MFKSTKTPEENKVKFQDIGLGNVFFAMTS